MKLIYTYVINYRNFKDLEFTLTSSYRVQLVGSPHDWKGIRISKSRSSDNFQRSTPKNILSISAIVGRNATGKTNFVEMLGANYQDTKENGDSENAYFLMYAPNNDENAYFFFEVVSPNRFGSLFSWMQPAKNRADRSPCMSGWCKYDSSNNSLVATEADYQKSENSIIISLRDHFQENPLNRTYSLPVRRRSKGYRPETFSSQVKVVQQLYGKEGRTVLQDSEYSVEAVCNMDFLENGLSGTPYETKPLFPVLSNMEKIPAESRKAVRLAESWLKFLFGTLLHNNFDSWGIVSYVIEHLIEEGRLHNPGHSEDGVFDITQVQQVLSHIISDLRPELEGYEIKVAEDDQFLTEILTNKVLERTESGFIIPVVSKSHVVEGTADLTSTLIDNFLRTYDLAKEFIQPAWKHISEGELWYIHFLASLSEVMEYIENAEDINTCILVLDEPETHMHPDLARQLLNNLTQWLQDYVKINIQIILTTHSPFVLSDLERGNVQILSRQGTDSRTQYGVKVNSPKKQTYAANIYALLTDSFFLDSGFGEMARREIKSIMEDLNGEMIDRSQREHIKRVIDSVGELLVQRKLNELFQKKSGMTHNQDKE